LLSQTPQPLGSLKSELSLLLGFRPDRRPRELRKFVVIH